MDEIRYPVLEVDLAAIEQNARAITGLCARWGIAVAGVVKFSDGQVPIAQAYSDGGCRQIGDRLTQQSDRLIFIFRSVYYLFFEYLLHHYDSDDDD